MRHFKNSFVTDKGFVERRIERARKSPYSFVSSDILDSFTNAQQHFDFTPSVKESGIFNPGLENKTMDFYRHSVNQWQLVNKLLDLTITNNEHGRAVRKIKSQLSRYNCNHADLDLLLTMAAVDRLLKNGEAQILAVKYIKQVLKSRATGEALVTEAIRQVWQGELLMRPVRDDNDNSGSFFSGDAAIIEPYFNQVSRELRYDSDEDSEDDYDSDVDDRIGSHASVMRQLAQAAVPALNLSSVVPFLDDDEEEGFQSAHSHYSWEPQELAQTDIAAATSTSMPATPPKTPPNTSPHSGSFRFSGKNDASSTTEEPRVATQLVF